MADLKNTTIDDTGFLQVASGNTGQRPGTPINGMIRFNSETNEFEGFVSGEFLGLEGRFSPLAGLKATGGTAAVVTIGANNYGVHIFTSSGTFTPLESITAEYLVIAGGGGGGGSTNEGGGGAGGYRCSVSGESSGGGASAESSLSLTAKSYTITVGSGGYYANGSPSTIKDGANTLVATVGGGQGSDASNAPSSGGSGGGGGRRVGGKTPPEVLVGAAGTSGEGYAGGDGDTFSGGGGGAGAVGGTDNETGGIGVQSSITGTAIYRAGGGGTSSNGLGYGQNTGGGGGADSDSSGTGDSGVVIIRYQL